MTYAFALAVIASASAFVAVLLFVMKPKTKTIDADKPSKDGSQAYLQGLKDIENQVREKKIDGEQADQKRLLLLEKHSRSRQQEGGWHNKLLQHGQQTPFIVALGALAVACIVGLFVLQTGRAEQTINSASRVDIANTTQATTSKESLQALREYLSGGLEQAAQVPLKTLPQSRPASLPDVDTMIARLVARLEKTPEDAAGWRTLGWSYYQTRKYDDAVKAYARAVKLNPNSVPVKVALGEAMVMADGANVKLRSIKLFKSVLELAPTNARALYFIGISKEQAGDHEGAMKDWKTALQKAPSGESWVTDLKSRILNTQGKDTASVAKSNTKLNKTSASALGIKSSAGEALPDAQTFRLAKTRAASMAPDERQAMIKGMVDRLDERLRSSPKDEAGWVRLMRSRLVLGQKTAAKKVLVRALAAFSDDTQIKDRITEKARLLGIEAD